MCCIIVIVIPYVNLVVKSCDHQVVDAGRVQALEAKTVMINVVTNYTRRFDSKLTS